MTNLGIDIGDDAIRLVETKTSFHKNSIINYGIKVLPFKITDKIVSDCLVDLINETPLHGRNAKISISGKNVRAQFTTFPELPKSELVSLVKNHFDKLIPFPPNECIVDLDIINSEPDNNLNVLIVSSLKKFVEKRIEMIKRADLTPTMVCVDAMVLHKLFVESKFHNNQKNYVLININEDKTNLVLIKRSNPVYIADITDYVDATNLAKDITKHINTAINNERCNEIDEIYMCGELKLIVELEKHIYDNNSNIAYRWNPFSDYSINPNLNCSEEKAYRLALALAIANA